MSNVLSEPMKEEVREIALDVVSALLPTSDDGKYISVKRASERFDIKEDTLRKWLRSGKLKKHNIKGCVRIKVSDLEPSDI